MTTKTTFKGFTFKKSSGQFVPPPPVMKPPGTSVGHGQSSSGGPSLPNFSKNASSNVGVTKQSSFSGSSSNSYSGNSVPVSQLQGGGKQTSSFTAPSAPRPVATVSPQGHAHAGSSSSLPAASTSSTVAPRPPTNAATSSLQPSSVGGVKRKKSGDAPRLTQKLSPSLYSLDDDDDDDFEMPSTASVNPKQKSADSRTSNKECVSFQNAEDSDDDEILPVRKRRSLMLQSDDEEECDGDFEGSLLSTTPAKSLTHQTKALSSSSAALNTTDAKRGSSLCGPSVSKNLAATTNSDAGPVYSRSFHSSQNSTHLSSQQRVGTPSAGGSETLSSKLSKNPKKTNTLGQQSWTSSEADEVDVTKHPLLTTDESKLNIGQLTEMRSLLLRVTDEVCDLVCSASTQALMNLGVSDYGRMQTLLAVRKQIKDKEKAVRSAAADTQICDSVHTPKPSTSSNRRSSEPGQLTPLPLATSTAVRKVPATKVQPVTDSPVPCGDSFFEDVSAFTQSHMTYMRGFKTPTTASPAAETTPSTSFQRQTSFSGLSDDGDGQPSERQTSGLLPPTRNLVTSGVASSRLDRPTSEESPLMLSQETNFIDFIDDNFDGPSSTIPVLDRSSSREASVSNRTATVVAESLISSEVLHDLIDEFDDDGDFDFCDPDLEFEAQAGTSTSSDLASPSTSANTSSITVSDPYVPMFGSSDKDDGATGEFDGEQFEHSKELRALFHNIFGLREFRHNQLQAINAALLGKDSFILMPTGGGKSLCYQLPALVTRGVSVIVSPLRALIQDQVQRLVSFDIPAAHLSGDLDNVQASNVYASLYQRQPGIKLLYVTPEKISASDKLLSCLDSLYRRQMLDRFVIDEAHCVSQWGHDFRPDYKKLNVLRMKFPGVPIMALTATATPRVRRDIIHQLDMKQPKWFMQSFNRPNLKYSVRPKKPSSVTGDVVDIIKSNYRNECGIVYCLSRKECDTVADNLKAAGIQAAAYHAGLGDSDRIHVQDRWLNGDNCKVICATIAFGMGIDKADVRFVFHYSLPKSVEGYYQEAGRAGRDGMIAHCILFYTYADVKRLRHLMDRDQSVTYESKRVHIDNLFRMVQYCENKADCRRAQVLHYFGEHHFDRERCNIVAGAVCDNCGSKGMFKLRDVTDDAKEVVKGVRELTSSPRNNYTLLHFVEIFRGSQNSRIMDAGHNRLPLHGRGAAYTRGDAERLMHKLVIEGVLIEELKITAADTAACYIRLGPKAASLMQNKMKIEMSVQGGRKRSEASRIGQEPQTSRQQLVEDCYKELVALAKTIATGHGSKNYALIFPNAMLWQLAEKTPLTVEEMKRDIDGLPETKINKYGAHRFLDITTKFCVMLASIQDEMEDDGQGVGEDADDWASPYFEAPSTSSRGRKKSYGRQRGGRSQGRRKGRGGSRKRGSSSSRRGGGASSYRGGGASSQRGGNYGARTSRGGTGGSGQRGGSTFTGGRRPNVPVSKSTLGMMPDPRARSYLASIGSYMG